MCVLLAGVSRDAFFRARVLILALAPSGIGSRAHPRAVSGLILKQ